MDDLDSLFIVPRLRVQNANAVSSNLTWGFPAMSAFVGVMQRLERKAVAAGMDILFDGVGVVCHDHDAHVSRSGYVRTFNLTRNPVDKSGKTAAIVEEGRIHLDVSLVFAIRGAALAEGDEERKAVAGQLEELLHTMRIAGGTIVPALSGTKAQSSHIQRISDDSEEQRKQFLSLRRRLIPGFALVLRDDLLQTHFEEMQKQDPTVTRLDAWLDLSRLNMTYETREDGEVEWAARRPPGWVVPIPVGYSALSELHEPGTVANARDGTTPFRFVESLYTLGQWISPHRLEHPRDLLWFVDNNLEQGLYRLQNNNPLQRDPEAQEILHG